MELNSGLCAYILTLMLILGIDPGTATTGFGVIKLNKNITNLENANSNMEVWKMGLIETPKEIDPGKRLHAIHNELDFLIEKYTPDVMAIERLFFATNIKTAMSVGQAVGVMMYTAATRNLAVVEYAPGTIKKVITGNGRADKKEMQANLQKILGSLIAREREKIKKTHFDNAADAIAVALCHAVTADYVVI